MIRIAVSAQREFLFPADLATTAAFFRDFERVLQYLPHLRLIETFAPDQYRVLFSSTEAGLYRLAFYCDLQVKYDAEKLTLHITPLAGHPPVPAEARLGSLTGQGYYSASAAFHPAGGNTRVEYRVEIASTVAKRLEWRLIPDSIIERVANERTRQRLIEMTDQFIVRCRAIPLIDTGSSGAV